MIINKRKCNPTCSKFKCNGSVIEDGKVIANKCNDFFVNVGPSLAKNIPSTKKRTIEYITKSIDTVFAVSPVSDHEILKILGDMKDSAAGWDELRPNMIKQVKQDIKLSSAHTCNLSFCTGVFPSDLKVANVVHICKANDEMIFSNYRPVSVLPVFSKLIERLMYNRLIQYINENKLLYEYQFGFQRGKSTHMALIVSLDKISEALDRGECVIGCFLIYQRPSTLLITRSCLEKCKMVFRAWLYIGLRIIYTIQNNMLLITPTSLIRKLPSVVFLKAPNLVHCSF